MLTFQDLPLNALSNRYVGQIKIAGVDELEGFSNKLQHWESIEHTNIRP
jgi:hypothetical protein